MGLRCFDRKLKDCPNKNQMQTVSNPRVHNLASHFKQNEAIASLNIIGHYQDTYNIYQLWIIYCNLTLNLLHIDIFTSMYA